MAVVTSGATAQRVTVACTLTVGSNTESRYAVVRTSGTAGQTSTTSIPLQVAGPAGTSSVTCDASVPGGTLPTVNATAAINALQVAS